MHINAPDSLGPDVLVQTGVDAHILGAHLLLGELADLLDGPGSALLEANLVDALRHVNGALARHHLIDRRLVALLGLCLGHFSWSQSFTVRRTMVVEVMFSRYLHSLNPVPGMALGSKKIF